MARVVGGAGHACVGAFAAMSMSCPGCARSAYPVLPAFPDSAMRDTIVVGGGEGGMSEGREGWGAGQEGWKGVPMSCISMVAR